LYKTHLFYYLFIYLFIIVYFVIYKYIHSGDDSNRALLVEGRPPKDFFVTYKYINADSLMI